MTKLSVNDLEKIKSDSAAAIAFKDRTYCLICGGTGCHATGSIAVKTALEQEIASRGIEDRVKVVETGCNGFCAMGPIMVVHPGDIFYQKLTAEDIPELVESQLVKGQAVERLLYKDPVTKQRIASQND
ncbi:MAG: (2Fe-2S) ferredoxin domain-containing protein, partial [Desulfobacterales bacterium]